MEQRKQAESVPRQQDVSITTGAVGQKLKGMPNWKSPAPDEVQRFWLKNFHRMHGTIAEQIQQCLDIENVSH